MIEVGLLGGGECRIGHEESGAEIRSSMAPEYGGTGGAFSSTDLLAAALGSCIATNLEPVATRHSVPLERLRITVKKTLGMSPKRIESLFVKIEIRASTPSAVVARLARAADHCVVHHSLSPDITVSIRVEEVTG